MWLAVLGGVFLVAAMAALVDSAGWGYDFDAYYLAALRLARGDGIYELHTLAGPFRPGPVRRRRRRPERDAITRGCAAKKRLSSRLAIAKSS